MEIGKKCKITCQLMKNFKKINILLIASLVFSCAPKFEFNDIENFQCYPNVVYIFRHAEKQKIKGEKNPELTKLGYERAKILADSMKYVSSGIIYSSEFSRTQQTVSELSTTWNTNSKIHRSSDPQGQVKKALSQCSKNVFISGHSNTIPTLIKLFGIVEEITIEDSQYGDLFQIRWKEKKPFLLISQVGPKSF